MVVAGYASVRAGLQALLASDSSLHLLGDSPAGGDTLARLLPTLRPDVILVDTAGDGASGDSVGRVLAALPASGSVAVVVLGEDSERDLPRLARHPALSGWGYLLREADGPQIAQTVRAVARGVVVLDPAALPDFPEPSRDGPATTVTPSTMGDSLPGETLTPRETEVLQLMAEGLPNKIIATRLGISLHTAKFHVAQILGKLDATSRTEAVTIGARRGAVIL